MADPFSITVGVAGFISLSIEVTKITGEYIRGVHHATEDAEEFVKQLRALTGVLRQLQQFLEQDAIVSANFNQTSTLFRTHNACQQRLNNLKSKLEHGLHNPDLMKSLTWPIRGKEYRQTIQDLKQWVEMFHFALTMEGCRLLARSSHEVFSALKTQLDETSKISKVVPSLEKSAAETADRLKQILSAVSSLGDIHTKINDVVNNIDVLSNVLSDRHTQREYQEKRQKLLEWLSDLDFRPRHLDNVSNRSSSTGKWLLQDEKFQAWVNGQGPAVLWCTGKSGSGKTMLASLVIQYLMDQIPHINAAVAYIYLDYKDKNKQTEQTLLSNLLRQLLEQIEDIPSNIMQTFDRQQARQLNDLDVAQCVSFLKTTCESLNDTFIILDGIDESAESARHELMTAMQRCSSFAKVLITSRLHVNPDPDIHNYVSLEINARANDILLYIKGRKVQHPFFAKMIDNAPGLEKEIEKEIVDRVDGMFLLARLQMDSLITQTSARYIRSSLKKLPKTLFENFDGAMNRVNTQTPEYSRLAHSVISWIFYAKRPLKTDELCQALAVEPEDEKLEPSGIHEIEIALKVCNGLVIVDRQDNVFRLVHSSLHAYLLDCWSRKHEYAEKDIAIRCLVFLTFENFSIPCEQGKQLEERQKRYPFLKYAAQHWGEHIQSSFESEIEGFILRFLANESRLMSVLQVGGDPLPTSENDVLSRPSNACSIHLTLEHGLESTFHRLLAQGIPIDMRDARGETPLFIAAKKDSHDAASLLLERGAEADALNCRGTTPLKVAAANNSLCVAQTLLDNHAKVDLEASPHYGTALTDAAKEGHIDMLDLLFRHGASLDGSVRETGSPLAEAAGAGHTAIVAWLLEKGARVNRVDWPALPTAIAADNSEIISLLLQNHADVEAFDQRREPCLIVISKNKWPFVLRVARGEHNKAVKAGRAPEGSKERPKVEDIYEVLRSGQEPRYVEISDGTALIAAARRQNIDLIRCILAAGANVNFIIEQYGTALTAAASRENTDVVRTLLAAGADVNAFGGTFGTALITATAHERVENVNELLKPGAEVDTVHDVYGTALFIAIHRRSLELVRILVAAGANPDLITSNPDLIPEKEGPVWWLAITIATWELEERRMTQTWKKDMAERSGGPVEETLGSEMQTLTLGPDLRILRELKPDANFQWTQVEGIECFQMVNPRTGNPRYMKVKPPHHHLMIEYYDELDHLETGDFDWRKFMDRD